MKLIYCPRCNHLTALSDKLKQTTTCKCKRSAGKYLSDRCTAVFTKDTLIVGIDNTTFRDAINRYNWVKKERPEWGRVDFFFTGWIPTIPGEVVRVDSVKEVKEYPYEIKTKAISTMPVSL